MPNHRSSPLAVAGLAALLTATAVAAPPGGGSRPGGGPPGGMPGGGAPPITHPAPPARPVTAPNPNGSPPAARATNAPDTDRGRSEGKGKTDVTPSTMRTAGTVVSFSGTTLTLRLPTGVTKTFTVNANAFGQLKPQKGQKVVVTTAGGNAQAVSVVPAHQIITGTVTAVTRTTVTLKLPNGRTQAITVASPGASHMNLTPGTPVTVTTDDGGMTAARIVPGTNAHPMMPRPTASP